MPWPLQDKVSCSQTNLEPERACPGSVSDPAASSPMTSRMSSADGSPGVNLRATSVRAQIENQMSLLRLVHVTKRNRLIWFSSWAGTEAGISHKTAWAPLYSTVDFDQQGPLFCTPNPFLATASTIPGVAVCVT